MGMGPKVHVFFKDFQEFLMMGLVLECVPRACFCPVSWVQQAFASTLDPSPHHNNPRPCGSLNRLLQGPADRLDQSDHLWVTQHPSLYLCPSSFHCLARAFHLLKPLTAHLNVSYKEPSRFIQGRWASSTPSL